MLIRNVMDSTHSLEIRSRQLALNTAGPTTTTMLPPLKMAGGTKILPKKEGGEESEDVFLVNSHTVGDFRRMMN